MELSREQVVEHYNRWAPMMENVPDFYKWVLYVLAKERISKKARIADIGCGTGALLRLLGEAGYTNLTGVDFSPECLDIFGRQAQPVSLYLHDIETGPLREPSDVVLMTGVVDFLATPDVALSNVRASLADNGYLLLTIRNRLAYFPWYHLRYLSRFLAFSPRLAHWFLWLTTPLGMRRSDQPFERVYAPSQMRRMLRTGGFRVRREYGSEILPMLWIPDLAPAIGCMRRLDLVVRELPPLPLCFRYMFVCQKVPDV